MGEDGMACQRGQQALVNHRKEFGFFPVQWAATQGFCVFL